MGRKKRKKPQKTGKSPIAYQGKDIVSKILADGLKGKSFAVYGLDVPRIKAVLPTNLPAVSADERRMDYCVLFEDGSVAIVDFESSYRTENKHKYIDYANRTEEWLRREYGHYFPLRVIVIYTADVKEDGTESVFDVGALRLSVEEAFLSALPKEELFKNLEKKRQRNEPLLEEELMQLIILPMAYEGKSEKNRQISKILDLIEPMEDRKDRVFILAGMAVFTDHAANEENKKRIWRLIKMTGVGRLFEEEKEQYAKQYAKQYAQKKLKENTDNLMAAMRKQGISEEMIQKITSTAAAFAAS